MTCKNCNQEIQPGSTVCPNCGISVDAPHSQVNNAVYNQNSGAPAPEYNQTKSIIFLIWGFFCGCAFLGLVFSILALINGNKVSTFNAMGNHQEAWKAYNDSEKWNKFALIFNIIGSVLIFLYIILYFVIGISFLGASRYY